MPGARGKIRQDQARCWSTCARSPQIRVNQERTNCDRRPPPLHLHGKMTPRPADNAARSTPREEQWNSSFTRRTRVPTVSRDNDASNVLPTCARRVGTVSEPPEGMPPTLLSPAGRRPWTPGVVTALAHGHDCRRDRSLSRWSNEGGARYCRRSKGGVRLHLPSDTNSGNRRLSRRHFGYGGLRAESCSSLLGRS
jgi:hypothetical protein